MGQTTKSTKLLSRFSVLAGHHYLWNQQSIDCAACLFPGKGSKLDCWHAENLKHPNEVSAIVRSRSLCPSLASSTSTLTFPPRNFTAPNWVSNRMFNIYTTSSNPCSGSDLALPWYCWYFGQHNYFLSELFCKCRMFSSIIGLYPLEASSIPKLWLPNMSPDIAKWLQVGGKTTPGRELLL